jgi:iron complex outermembrane recepter protein
MFAGLTGPVSVGAYTQFVDDVYQNAVFDASNNKYVVKGQTTVNLFVNYTLPDKGVMSGTTVTLGVRNLFDKDPPLASGGYLSSLYQPQARYWYTSVKKRF